MNIKQVEDLTGISKQNIRFYEKEGLIKPVRNKINGYREYEGEEVRKLKLIKILRMLDMPLEQISQIIKGTKELTIALTEQQMELERRMSVMKIMILIKSNNCVFSKKSIGYV